MKSVDLLPGTTFSGRRFTRRQLSFVQQSVERFPNLSRKEVAQTLCEHLRWKTPNGKNKTESCLKMLQALEDQGVVKLPDKRERATPQRSPPAFEHEPCDPPIECALESVRPIRLELVRSAEDRQAWKAYLQTHHYLGYRQPVGWYGNSTRSDLCKCLTMQDRHPISPPLRAAWKGISMTRKAAVSRSVPAQTAQFTPTWRTYTAGTPYRRPAAGRVFRESRRHERQHTRHQWCEPAARVEPIRRDLTASRARAPRGERPPLLAGGFSGDRAYRTTS
jgi:hypothetical protein